jgi:Uncharacterised protein family (UPF0236)
MQVAITCPPIVVEVGLDSNALEAIIVAWGRQVMTVAYQLCWQHLEATLPTTCPHCQADDSVADGHRPYQLRTVFGPVTLNRQRRQCRPCQRHFQPADAALPSQGRATAGLVQAATLAAASWPFATAAQVLHALSGAVVSPEWVRQVAERAGHADACRAQEQADALVSGQAEVPDVHPREEGLVALDGGWVASHDTPHGMEGKVAVLATGRETIGHQRRRLTERHYVASFASADDFGKRVYREALTLGLAAAPQLVVLGDGAAWISELTAYHFPQAERRLDLWHLLTRAHEAVQAEGLTEVVAETVWAELRELLRQGAVAAALTLVAEHLPGPVGQTFAGYLANQRAWIVDAQSLQAQGDIVGSGAVEKGVDLVINRRLKGHRGMRWRRANATALVTLRTQILNDQAAA